MQFKQVLNWQMAISNSKWQLAKSRVEPSETSDKCAISNVRTGPNHDFEVNGVALAGIGRIAGVKLKSAALPCSEFIRPFLPYFPVWAQSFRGSALRAGGLRGQGILNSPLLFLVLRIEGVCKSRRLHSRWMVGVV